jgi:hypothetical protein
MMLRITPGASVGVAMVASLRAGQLIEQGFPAALRLQTYGIRRPVVTTATWVTELATATFCMVCQQLDDDLRCEVAATSGADEFLERQQSS